MYGVDEYIFQYDNELGPPWKSQDLWIKLSYPFFHADRITTPTLFMGGDKDFNVPVVGGEQMYQALQSNGSTASSSSTRASTTASRCRAISAIGCSATSPGSTST